jgi:hypothetical protein
MIEKKYICPICSKSESTFKVSDIYIQGLLRLRNGDKAEAPIIDELQKEIPEERRDKLKGSRYYRELMESFAPPQGEGKITRAINPDLIAFFTGLFGLYFLYQIFTTQYFAFWYVVAFIIIAYAAYFYFRKQIFIKFNAQKMEESGSKGTIEKAVGYWMKLYYCSKDNVVFSSSIKEGIPISQMRSYLMSLAAEKKK